MSALQERVAPAIRRGPARSNRDDNPMKKRQPKLKFGFLVSPDRDRIIEECAAVATEGSRAFRVLADGAHNKIERERMKHASIACKAVERRIRSLRSDFMVEQFNKWNVLPT